MGSVAESRIGLGDTGVVADWEDVQVMLFVVA